VYLPGNVVIGILAIFLLVSSVVSLVVLPITLVLFAGVRRDTAFWTLRLLAFANLVAPLAVAVASLT